jgi:NAD(P)-dependent dehydrogenase (short-subunit alcohol dehydrogenase family)
LKLSACSAIVTGGASGLGEATARLLAVNDVRVAIFDVNDQKGMALAQEIGGLFCHVDVTSDESVEGGFAQARAGQGQERILINCAGIGATFRTAWRDRETGAIHRFPMEQFDRIVQINLLGTFRCSSQSAAGMLTLGTLEDGERGVIINTASVAAQDGQMGQAAYSASKAGIVGMTLPIARDLMSAGIRVNAILPGIFDTPLMAAAPEKVRMALAESVPFPKRFGRPTEFASMALELCRNSYMNGESVRLDGAIRMAAR